MSRAAASEVAFLARALKAPRIAACCEHLARRAVEEGWDHPTYLAAVLAEEVAARETHGGQHRVKAARFPQVKTLDDFDFSFQRSVKRQTIAHLAQLDFLAEAHNVIFLGPPGTGKTHLSIALGVQAARRGIGWPSPRPRSGSGAWPRPARPDSSTTSWSGCAASRCSSSTRSATSPSIPTPPPCSSAHHADVHVRPGRQ